MTPVGLKQFVHGAKEFLGKIYIYCYWNFIWQLHFHITCIFLGIFTVHPFETSCDCKNPTIDIGTLQYGIVVLQYLTAAVVHTFLVDCFDSHCSFKKCLTAHHALLHADYVDVVDDVQLKHTIHLTYWCVVYVIVTHCVLHVTYTILCTETIIYGNMWFTKCQNSEKFTCSTIHKYNSQKYENFTCDAKF